MNLDLRVGWLNRIHIALCRDKSGFKTGAKEHISTASWVTTIVVTYNLRAYY